MGGEGWKASWGPQDDADSVAAIHAGVEKGANWIDTAPVYGLGHAETVVGQALQGMTEKPLVATKCGRRGDADSLFGDLSPDAIRAECEESLRRLGVDCIDLYQMHWPDPDPDIEAAWGAMSQLVDEGKVRFLGVSNFSVAQMRRLMDIHPITSLQPPYSMLRRDVEEEILPFCLEHRIGVIGYSPMYRGLLSGAFSQARVDGLPASDHRRRDPLFSSPKLDIVLELVEQLRSLASIARHGPAELAIAWVLHNPAVTGAIVGLRTAAQADVLAAGGWRLDDFMYSAVVDALDAMDARLAGV
jgi:aryl-alcohol dehydrogenase-like predicted oxidoreductase